MAPFFFQQCVVSRSKLSIYYVVQQMEHSGLNRFFSPKLQQIEALIAKFKNTNIFAYDRKMDQQKRGDFSNTMLCDTYRTTQQLQWQNLINKYTFHF